MPGDVDVAVPKRRKSVSAKGKRRSHDALTPINLTICPMCKQSVPTHRVHAECLAEHMKSGAPGRMPF
ncbi:MAG: 50S ribosomal protein L32 [Paludisphaera borealis]|nr:50S ribosomal protein L32 [Paludisphaera borealis]MDR3621106.1 50S ribosomal protein L32 [Paludisphaera borealis]